MYEERYLIQILAYLMNVSNDNIDFPIPSADIDWVKMLKFAQENSVGGLLFYVLPYLPSNMQPDENIKNKMRELSMSIVASDIKQRAEIEEIKRVFAEKELHILFLKGANTKKLYPKSEWRTMGDIDMFYDRSQYTQVKDTLHEMGYTNYEVGSKHDSCAKPPYISLELHHTMVKEGEIGALYYHTWWEEEKRKHPQEYIHQFNLEEQYIYSMLHLYEHFKDGGVGIRFILDVYVFLQNTMDTQYVRKVFEQLEIDKFAQNIELLAMKWFSTTEVECTDILSEMENFILQNGIYGNLNQRVDGMLERKGRIRYVLSSLFPKLYVMRASYPVLNRVPVLLPIMWLARLWTILFKRQGSIKRGIKTVTKGDKTKGKKLVAFYKCCGINEE